jgi:hypothetical protein
LVTPWQKRQFQHAECFGIANFAMGVGRAKRAMIFAASADNEFANASDHIRFAVRILGREALIIVIVTIYNDLGIGKIEAQRE